MQAVPTYIPEKAIKVTDELTHQELLEYGFTHVSSWHYIVDHHIYRHEGKEVDFYFHEHASRCTMYFSDSKEPGDLGVNLSRLQGAFTSYENTVSFGYTFWLFGILCFTMGISKPKPKKELVKKVEQAVVLEPIKQQPLDLFS